MQRDIAVGKPAGILARQSEIPESLLRPRAAVPPIDVPALGRYLQAHGMRLASDEVRQFAGGLANRNYLLRLDSGLAVLRCPPAGDLPPGAHDMGREHRILRSLWKALDFAPRSMHLCMDREVLGVPFQLLEFRAGMVVRGDDMAGLDASRVGSQLSELLVGTLARIHAVDTAPVGLDALGRPADFYARAVAGWAKRGRRIATGPRQRGLVEEIAAWLARQEVADHPGVLLHCDFKLDNCILVPDTLVLEAVVDWDMGTRGHPLFDLATMVSYWSQPGDPDCMMRLGQMPTSHPGFWNRDQAVARYAEITGQPLDDFAAFRVLALLKLGVVMLQLHAQWADGETTDERYRAFAALGEELLAMAWDVARGRQK